MVLIGDEQDTKHKEAMDAARDAIEKMISFFISPVHQWLFGEIVPYSQKA